MNPELFLGRYDLPDSIATKKNVDQVQTSVDNALSVVNADLALLKRIPWQICRTNIDPAEQPTTLELKGIAPRDTEVTTVILANGTREIWQYSSSTGWALKSTLALGNGGQGGFATSTNGQHETVLQGTTETGQASSVEIFNDPGRVVTVTVDLAALTASGCLSECEIIYNVDADSWHFYTGGAVAAFSAVPVRMFKGTMSPRQFAKQYQAHGHSYCNNYHQCYVLEDISARICVHRQVSGSHTVTVTTDNGSDYSLTVNTKSGTAVIQSPTGGGSTVTQSSGTPVELLLTDFLGDITVTANPDSDDIGWTTSLNLPDVTAGCC